MRTRGSFYQVAINNRTKGARDHKAMAEGRRSKANDIIDLDESDSEKWISKKRSREARNEKKKKKGFKETVNEKLNGNASGSDSQAAKAQVNVVKDSKPSNENVNSP